MKQLLILITAIVLFSCGKGMPDDNGNAVDEGLQVVEVNKCQYVIYLPVDSRAGATMVHAGNCNNPVHNNVSTPVVWDSLTGKFLIPN